MIIKSKFLIITSNSNSYPEIFGCPLILKALENKIWEYEIFNLYDFGITKHKKIDCAPFGGGAGLLIRADVIENAINAIEKKYPKSHFDVKYYCTDPSGKIFNQKIAYQICQNFQITEQISNSLNEVQKQKIVCFLSPRFEGLDSRIFQYYDFEKISIGKFIVTNGDLIVSIVINSVLRLIDGVLGKVSSTKIESFSNEKNDKQTSENENLEIEFDQFTKPRIWNGIEVPKILLSGHHNEIEKHRIESSKKKTLEFQKKNKKE